MRNRKKGFTLVELIVVIVIILILSAVAVPLIIGYVERSLEAVDVANVRTAYSEVVIAASSGDFENAKKIVPLEQNQDGWQSMDVVTIAGISHANSQGDTVNWKGTPVAHGECEVSYSMENGILFDWRGGSNSAQNPYPFDVNEDLFQILKKSGLLETTLKNNNNFEIDSRCSNSSMLPQVQAQIGENSLLNQGTWAYLGSAKDSKKCYLYWTSVNTDKVGASKRIPVIIQTGDGRYYLSETTTATRKNKKVTYTAIADHIKNYESYLSEEKRYDSLQSAYDAYEEIVKKDYPDYQDTLLR